MNVETSKKWEGQVVEGRFPLHRFLGGTEGSAVFLTDSGQYKPREAAIKLIPAESRSSEQQISRWKRAGSLNHPHLIRMWDVGRCQLNGTKLLYVVMECADEDLSQILPQRPLTPAEAGDMLRPVLDALAYLHGRGLAHGHLKPSNIMAIGDRLKISSDGICLAGEPALHAGEPGQYDAPEVMQAGRTAAGDVWSLGMTLSETLLQRVPTREQKDQDPVPPATLPPPFREIVRQCLRVDPSLRASLADILTRLNAPPEVAAPAPAIVPPTPLVHRSRMRMRLAYGAAIAVAMVLAFWIGLHLFNPSSSADRSAPVAVQTPEQQSAEPPATKPAPHENAKPPAPASQLPSHLPPAATSDNPVQTHPAAPSSESLSATRSTEPNAGAAPPNAPSSAGPSATSPSAPTGAQTPAFPPNFKAGEVARQVLPLVPEQARDTIRGTVRVRVRVEVDPSGDVTGADLDTPGPSHYFANLSLDAARKWKFTPAKSGAQDVASAWELRFDFSQIATKAVPTPVTP